MNIPFPKYGSVPAADTEASRPGDTIEVKAYLCDWLLRLDDDLECDKLVPSGFDRHGP